MKDILQDSKGNKLKREIVRDYAADMIDSSMDKKELMTELEGLKSALEVSISEKTKSEIADQLKSVIASVDEKINAFSGASDSADSLKSMTDELTALKSAPIFGYGGFAFNLEPQLREQIPGIFLGETMEIAIQKVNELLGSVNQNKSLRKK